MQQTPIAMLNGAKTNVIFQFPNRMYYWKEKKLGQNRPIERVPSAANSHSSLSFAKSSYWFCAHSQFESVQFAMISKRWIDGENHQTLYDIRQSSSICFVMSMPSQRHISDGRASDELEAMQRAENERTCEATLHAECVCVLSNSWCKYGRYVSIKAIEKSNDN